jgi:Mce-associated membrane protein
MPGPPAQSRDEVASSSTPRASRVISASRASWSANPLLAVSVVLVAIAVACAAWFGSSWLRAASSGTLGLVQARDQALQVGEQEILNLNTLDYRTVHQGLAIWLASSTGRLHHYFTANEAAFAQDVIKTKAVTTARILDAALTRLNAAAGTATIIAAVEVTVIPQAGRPTIKTESEQGQLIRTPDGWKLSFLTIPPSGAPGSAPTPGSTPAPGSTPTPGGTASPGPSRAHGR